MLWSYTGLHPALQSFTWKARLKSVIKECALLDLFSSSSWFATSLCPIPMAFLPTLFYCTLCLFYGDTNGKQPQQMQIEDSQSLLAFKKRIFNDPYGTLVGWNPNDIHPCNWTGVSCVPGTFRVKELSLPGRALEGSLGPELGMLSHLEHLDISLNAIRGPIPPEIGNLTNLQILDLFENQLSGSVPKELGKLRNLRRLYLWENLLSGSIPRELGQLTSLEEFSLSDNHINGSIPIEVGQMRSLKHIYLSSNNLSGSIPREIGHARNLTIITMPDNRLSGSIPNELGQLTSLQSLYLSSNNLSGSIPAEFGQLKSLEDLDLQFNQLSGSIPGSLGKLPNLRNLYLSYNKLTGSIPKELGRLESLADFVLDNNELTGSIPPELGLLKRVVNLNVGNNRLSGRIPSDLGQIKTLKSLSLAINNLTGNIPPELGELDVLEGLYLYKNDLSGSIPSQIGNLSTLTELYLGNNQLSAEIPEELSLLTSLQSLNLQKNNITGSIPSSMGRLRSLEYLDLSSNKLSGAIPPILSNCSNLNYFSLDYNYLEGNVPSELGSLQNLSVLSLSFNNLTGEVPASFGNLKNLMLLNLGHNHFRGPLPVRWKGNKKLRLLSLEYNLMDGSFPDWIWGSSELHVLDLSNNLFSGHISSNVSQLQALWTTPDPSEFGSQDDVLWGNPDILSGNGLTNLGKMDPILNFKGHQQAFQRLYRKEGFIDLSVNQIRGGIPSQFSLLKGLRSLNVSSNKLEGRIPPDFGNLPILESLDLSYNILDGRIPEELTRINSLEILNLSYNYFSGPIPSGGQFDTFDKSSFWGNKNLCGSQVSKICGSTNRTIGTAHQKSPRKGSRQNTRLILITAPTVFAAIILFSFIFYRCWIRSRIPHKPLLDVEMYCFEKGLKVTAKDLSKSTDGYSDENIIGKGASSTVYRGKLDNGQLVAVKKFKIEEQSTEIQRSFATECKTLGKIRHRNLVKILGVVSNRDTKILVLPFMVNGSLDMHLHNFDVCSLSWEIRLKISVSVAQAMVYLHEECGVGEIVHCDLKPSNILLDQEFEAHVNDFGIARLIDPDIGGATLSSTFRGSIGYIAPEFPYSSKVSPKADVYSYGVVLLEMVTRRRPTNATFVEHNSMADWARSLYPSRAMDTVDSGLIANATVDTCEQILSTLRLALACTRVVPSERPSMRDVLGVLESIRSNQPLTDFPRENN